MSNKKKYVTVGSLIFQSEFDDDGKPIKGKFKVDEKGRKLYSIKLDKNAKVVINGVDFSGKTLYVSRPDSKLERLLNSGVIDQEEYEKRLEEHSPGGRLEFIQMEIAAALDK